MSGHSHWAGIKHKKEVTDQKRGKAFSKLLAAISAAARSEPNPDFNPRPDPISEIPSRRVRSSFLISARRDEEAVAQATATRSNTAGREKSTNPAGYGESAAITVSLRTRSAVSTPSSLLLVPPQIHQYRGRRYFEMGSGTAVQKAKEASVPAENIERALKRASESGQNLEELTFEAYGPGSAAILIEAISDNRNRTVAEVKKILSDLGGKWGESGSVRWAFEKETSTSEWKPKFNQDLNEEDKIKLKELIKAIEEYDDVQKVYTNTR